MGRSVSYPSNNEIVVYDYIEGEDLEEDWYWEEYKDNLRYNLKENFKSLTDCNTFLGNEDLAILENQFCYIGLSSYFDIISIWVVIKEDLEENVLNLAKNWVNQIKPQIEKLGRLKKQGTFSNGVSVYNKI